MTGEYVVSDSRDPAQNLALEEFLLQKTGEDGRPRLWFWKNDPVVVIGRNQNAGRECSLSYAREHGIAVIRRKTGGGAVYHDAGNLNYSILLPKEWHDIVRSTAMIVRGLQHAGIPAEANGRNDICVKGRKISGNAYYLGEGAGLHHGTLLFMVDTDAMEAVLTVPEEKLARHGISSVRARVGGITSLVPGVQEQTVVTALKKSFCQTYGLQGLETASYPVAAYEDRIALYRDPGWNFGFAQGEGQQE